MSDFQATIERHATEFAYAILAAVKNMSVNDLRDFLAENAGAARHTPPVPAPARAVEPPFVPAPLPPLAAAVDAGPTEMEVSVLEHLNEAGPTGSTVRAWVISTQGELPADEHAQLEEHASQILDALEARGTIQKRGFSKSRGTVYALSPV